MAVEVVKEKDGLIHIIAIKELSAEDYRTFTPVLEEAIAENGPLYILFEVRDFHGWTWGGVWEEFKFDYQHGNDVERLAMVGERVWHEWMGAFAYPFQPKHVRYFAPGELPAAREWLNRAELPNAQGQALEQKFKAPH